MRAALKDDKPIVRLASLPTGQVSVLIAKALYAAARVLEAEMNGRMTYVSGTTILNLSEDRLAERWLVKANDWIFGWLDVLRQKNLPGTRFGCMYVGDVLNVDFPETRA